ncbi:MAG: AMP-binding protein [Oscillospiraceae bacterium]|jgi:long-chain acyl-CoA synthetase|nr:AMP-binding protein [Oscillospiraceae bacterium]
MKVIAKGKNLLYFLRVMDKKSLESLQSHSTVNEVLDYMYKFKNKKALVYKDTNNNEKFFTYSEFVSSCKKAALFLNKKFSGERIALISRSDVDWIRAYFAIIYSGNTAVLIPESVPEEVASIMVSKSNSKAILCDKQNFVISKKISKNLNISFVKKTQAFFSERDKRTFKLDISLDPESEACILFTSGTTTFSKGVVLTHTSIVSNIYSAKLGFPWANIKKSLLMLPLFHIFGLIHAMLARLSQGTVVYIANDMKAFIKNILWSKPSVLALVPAQIETLIDMIESDSSLQSICKNLKAILAGGSNVNSETKRKLLNYNIQLYQGYGLTECMSIAGSTDKSSHFDSVGKVYPGNKVKIGQDGEILFKGKILFKKYLDPEQTKEAFDKEGWYKTGDLGHFDKDDFLYVTGRKKFLIILDNGENISPEEIESLICRNKKIKEALAFETKLANNTKVVGMEVYAPELSLSNISDIIDKTNCKLEKHKRIHFITKREEPFPKNAANKIIRTGFENSLLKKIKKNLISSSTVDYKEKDITLDSKFVEDLGISSVSFGNIVVQLEEELGIEILIEDMSKILTVGDFCAYIQKRCRVCA